MLAFCFLASILVSCHGDDAEIPWESRENTVTLEFLADNNSVTLEAYINHYQRLDTIKSGQRYTFKTTKGGTRCRVSCSNNKVNLTIKGYINGKLKKEVNGQEYLVLNLDIK